MAMHKSSKHIKADKSGIGYVSAGYVLKGNATGFKEYLKIYTG
jgi:hypothetical protein